MNAKLKQLKLAMEKEAEKRPQQRDLHRLDQPGFESLDLSKLLFYHAPRTGEEFEDDGWDTFNIWETYAYSPAVYESFVSMVEATEAIDRELTVRWGSAAAGSVGDVSLRLLGSVNRQSAAAGFDHYTFNYRTGEYFDDEAFHPQQQADGWRAVLEALGALSFFRETEVGGITLPVFASNLATRPAEHGDYTVADLKVGGRQFFAAMHNDAIQGGKHFQASISTKDLKHTREGLDLVQKAIQAATSAIDKPSDVTLDFSCLTGELESFSELLARVGSAFPLVSVLIPYRKGFRPLAPQKLDAGQIRAYPLLILKRYKEAIAPVAPLLAVNAVHTDGGMWIELQSSQHPELIERAAAILGGEAEFWKGSPEDRWGWYPGQTWPGLPRVACGSAVPSPVASATKAVPLKASKNSSATAASGRPTTEKPSVKKAIGHQANAKKAAKKSASGKDDSAKTAAKKTASTKAMNKKADSKKAKPKTIGGKKKSSARNQSSSRSKKSK